MGAKPEVVLDTILCGKLEKGVVVDIVKCISQACRDQDCTLIGGETSEQPGVLAEGQYMLNASIVGVVDRDKVLDGRKIRHGDVILAMASNGLHTNGYSLVRKIMAEAPEILERTVSGNSFLDEILSPHVCYYHPMKDLLDMEGIHGLAHITGGGIAGNLIRILPDGHAARIDLAQIDILPIFHLIHSFGKVPAEDMLRTFNLGVGMAMVAESGTIPYITEHLLKFGISAYHIGEIVEGTQRVEFVNELRLAKSV